MTDIQTMKDMLTGLKQKKKNLEADEKVFLKVSGLNEEIEKANQEKSGYEEELTEAKKRRDDAKARKAKAVSETTSRIAEKMNQVLPFGEAVFLYDEDDDGKRSMLIGWRTREVLDDGPVTANVIDKITPYNGLSGAQKQIFDSALMNVLDADIIVVEAAELDPGNLGKTLAELSGLDKQVIVNCWYPLYDKEKKIELVKVPDNFVVVGV